MRGVRLFGLVLSIAFLLAAPVVGQSTHVLVVTGLGGAPQFTARFAEWGETLVDAAEAADVPADHITWLAERADVAPGVDGAARKEAVLSAVASLADRSVAGDVVLLALFGHGSARGGEARINLPGPDLTAGELAAALAPLSDRRVVVVNAASASGGFVEPLSAPGRVVITATRSTRENEATRFGGYFVEALAGGEADTDKDGRVSMLEAFEFARLEVERAYADAGQLATEHALIEDSGDGQGSLQAGGDDGALAATLALAPVAAAAVGDSPELRALRDREAELRQELAELRTRQDSMTAEAYQAELERLLLEIARTGQAIREAEAGADSVGGGG